MTSSLGEGLYFIEERDRTICKPRRMRAAHGVVLLLHDLGSGRDSMRTALIEGASQGLAAVAVDLPYRVTPSDPIRLTKAFKEAVKRGLKELEQLEKEWPGAEVGVAGFSFGGILAFRLASLDPRVKAVASICSASLRAALAVSLELPSLFGVERGRVASLLREEEFKGLLSEVDRSLVKLPPRRVLLIGGLRDKVIPIDAVRYTYHLLKRAYKGLGEEGKVIIREYDMGHELSPVAVNDAMFWLKEWLVGGNPTS